MIDYLALAIGHGLMAIALLRLVLREDCDADPLIEGLKADIAADRMATSTAGRNAARRARAQDAGGDDASGDGEAGPSAQVAKRERDTPGAQVAKRERDTPGAQVAKR